MAPPVPGSAGGQSSRSSNTLPSLGGDYGASEAFVGVVCGVGVAVAGVLGGLAIPPLALRWPAERLFPIVRSHRSGVFAGR